jgi:hypothetical protein
MIKIFQRTLRFNISRLEAAHKAIKEAEKM